MKPPSSSRDSLVPAPSTSKAQQTDTQPTDATPHDGLMLTPREIEALARVFQVFRAVLARTRQDCDDRAPDARTATD